MAYRFEAKENKIIGIHLPSNEVDAVAECDNLQCANEAAKILNAAYHQNEESHYTASARLYNKAEQVPGFKWTEVK